MNPEKTKATGFVINLILKDNCNPVATKVKLENYPSKVVVANDEDVLQWIGTNTVECAGLSSTASQTISIPKPFEKYNKIDANHLTSKTLSSNLATKSEDGVNPSSNYFDYYLIVTSSDGTQQTLNIEDHLPEGLHYVEGSASLEFVNSFQEGNWMWSTDSNTWWIGPNDTNCSLYFDNPPSQNSDNVLNFNIKAKIKKDNAWVDGNIPAFDYMADSRHLAIAVKYQAYVDPDDEVWKNMKITKKTFTNYAYCNGIRAEVSRSVERPVKVLDKSGTELESDYTSNGETTTLHNGKIEYVININPGALDLNPAGNTIHLMDTMNFPEGVAGYLDLQSIQVLDYGTKEELDHSQYTVRYSDEFHDLNMYLPDEQALIVKYIYNYDIESLRNGQGLSMNNNASLSGGYSENHSTTFEVNKADSEVTRGNLYLNKVDKDDNTILLKNAWFEISAFRFEGDESEKAWSKSLKATTGSTGILTIYIDGNNTDKFQIEEDGNVTVRHNRLYKIAETVAPDGPIDSLKDRVTEEKKYVVDSTPRYVIWNHFDKKSNDDNMTNEERFIAAALGDGSKNSIKDKGFTLQQAEEATGVEFEQVRFYKCTDTAAWLIENDDQVLGLEVNKIWTDELGQPVSDANIPEKNIKVQLYRSVAPKKSYPVKVKFTAKESGHPDRILDFDLVAEEGSYFNIKAEVKCSDNTAFEYLNADTGAVTQSTTVKGSNIHFIRVGPVNGSTTLNVKMLQYHQFPGRNEVEITSTGILGEECFLPVILNKNNQWKYNWTSLPETDRNGNTYYYFVKELTESSGRWTLEESNNDGIMQSAIGSEDSKIQLNNIVSDETLSRITVQKVWKKQGTNEDTVPLTDSVLVKLKRKYEVSSKTEILLKFNVLANYSPVSYKELSVPIVVSKDDKIHIIFKNGWSETFDTGNHSITDEVIQSGILDLGKPYRDNGYFVGNSWKSSFLSYEIVENKETWTQTDDLGFERILELAKGNPVSWTTTVDNLPMEDSNGRPYHYYVEEETESQNWTVSYSTEELTSSGSITVTNTVETPEKQQIRIQKLWKKTDESNKEVVDTNPTATAVEVQIVKVNTTTGGESSGTVNVGNSIELTSENNWQYSTEMPWLEDGWVYSVKEISVTVDGKQVELESSDWEAQYSKDQKDLTCIFTITNIKNREEPGGPELPSAGGHALQTLTVGMGLTALATILLTERKRRRC